MKKQLVLGRVMLAAAIGGLVLAACASPTTTPTEAPTVVVESTIPVPPTEIPPAPGPTADPNVGVAVVPTAVPGGPTAIANYNTYIYSGPGTNYVVYGAFLGSATAQVVGKSESGAWWAVSVPPAPGGTGWVDGAWVTVSNVDAVPVLPTPPVPPTTGLVPPAAGDPQATALVNTYVRTGPGPTFPAYGVAPQAATGRVIGKSADGAWWVVRLDPTKVGAGYGWVTASTVTASNVDTVPVIESPTAPADVPPTTPPAGSATATAIDYVYIRSGAGTCFAPYGTAAPGATGEIAGKTADGLWWQVKIPTQFAASGLGWVSAGYVTTSNAGSVPAVETVPCAEVPVPPPTPAYSCSLQSQDPDDYSTLAAGEGFTMEWTVVNTGTAIWNKNVGVFVQSGAGGALHTGADSVGPLTDDISNGESLTLSVPGLAPSTPGTYGEIWQINANGTVVCEFWMIVEVE